MELIFVKGGTFEIRIEDRYSDEAPTHTVSLSSFYLSKYEITNYQFCMFLNEYDSVYVKKGKYNNKRLLTYDIGKPQCRIQIKGNKYIPKPGYENHPVNKAPCLLRW